MRILAVPMVVAVSVQAAVVQGVVLDDETGYPLARAQITLTPLPGTQATGVAIRSGDRGSFTILSVRPGWYVLRTARLGFAPVEAERMRPGRPRRPLK
jgi:hypothetical protein